MAKRTLDLMFRLWQEGQQTCPICSHRIDPFISKNSRFGMSIDHIKPVSKGGTDAISNYRLTHRGCNILRGAKGENWKITPELLRRTMEREFFKIRKNKKK